MEALVPNISDSINGECIDVVVKENSFLRDLELAHDGEGSGEIDILIGADLYWLLVDGEVKRNKGSGLIAIRSKFGWLVVQFQGLFLRVVLQKVVCRLLTYCVCKIFLKLVK